MALFCHIQQFGVLALSKTRGTNGRAHRSCNDDKKAYSGDGADKTSTEIARHSKFNIH
jgi:hypothetical protein